MAYTHTSQHAPAKAAKPQTARQYIKLLNTLLAATTEFLALFDTQGRFLYVNENIATLHSLKQSDFLGKTRQEVGQLAEFMEPFEDQIQKVMTTGQTVMKEVIFQPTGTQVRWFSYVASPIIDARGAVESVVVACRDITARKQIEEATSRLAAIVESSGDAILSKTLPGVITSWNSSAETLYGYQADEIIGKSVSLLIPPDRQNEMSDILALSRAGKTVKNYETTRMRKDGTSIEMSITVSPIRDPAGKIIGASTIAHNITERKQIVEELAMRKQMVEELAERGRKLEHMDEDLIRQRDELASLNVNLKEAYQIRGQFLATMSHELRTPLASIIGFSQMLLGDTHEPETNWNPQQRNNLKRILKNGQHLLGLINDVLDLSKIEASQMVVNYSRINVQELLTSVIEEIQSIAKAQHLVLKIEIGEGVDFLDSNEQKLHQVLLNLVSNALKFTEWGEVMVSARRACSPVEEADHLAFVVHDTGIGIPAHLHERIFEDFYQIDGSYTRKSGGTGLGLSIARHLTTLLGGTIAVKSAPGEGSTFTVTFPLRATQTPVGQDIPRLLSPQPQADPLSPASAPEFRPTKREKGAERQTTTGRQKQIVLAIDDNQDTLRLIKASLKRTLYTVIGVQNSSKVLPLVQEWRPCAIILDIMMPGLNGWQILHQLKENPATASIPVIILSALSEQATGYVLGAEAYMIKPFQTDVLLDTLRRVVIAKKDPVHVSKREAQAT